jgi:hypothetical protein
MVMLSALFTFAATLALNTLALFRETRLETIFGKAQSEGVTPLSQANKTAQKPIIPATATVWCWNPVTRRNKPGFVDCMGIRTIDLVRSRNIFIPSL